MSIAQDGSVAASAEIPVFRSDRVVPRTRLFDILDRALADPGNAPPVILVCAPAGSGKTTFLAEWAHRTLMRPDTPHVAWAAVVDEHNSPHTLRAELVRALTDPDRPTWLILDDAHLLHDPDALAELETVLRTPSDRLRVVVCGRFEPPLAFQKLRLDGRVLDVTFEDLAFTPEEATVMLAEHDIALGDDDLAALMERTEGWAAGLRLAGMSLAGHPDPSTMIENFTGCRRAVADYLIEQVLAGQSPEIREFLVKTSVPATFSAALAEELTGCTDAHAIIELLEHRNFLVSRIEGTPTLFRYHPLLRSYLRAEISLLGRRAVADLERVAAHWYAQFGDALPAVEHGVTAGDVSDVETVLRESGLALVLDGHGETLERLLAGAPQPIRDRTITRLVRAAAHLHADNAVVAESILGEPEDAASDNGSDRRTALFDEALRLQMAVHAGTLAIPPEADATASGDLLLDAFAELQRGRVHLHAGRLDDAAESLGRAREHAREAGSPTLAAQTSTELGTVALCRGLLDDAHTLVTAGRSTAPDTSVPDTRRAALIGTLCHYLRSDVGPAGDDDVGVARESTIASALSVIDRAPDRRTAVAGLHSAVTAGDRAPAPPGVIAACLPSIQFAYLHIGETTWARELTTDAAATLGRTGDVVLLEAVLHLCANQLERARATLLPVLDGEILCAAATNMVTAWLVEAELARRRGHDSRAHEAVGEALRLAEPERVLRPFHDMAAASQELLSASRGRFGSRDSFAETVWTSLPRTPASTVERLTPRELQLLAELPTWRTAEEIAADLCVSVNTVKTHLRGIYRKLGVTTRRDAVTAAHTHGLL